MQNAVTGCHGIRLITLVLASLAVFSITDAALAQYNNPYANRNNTGGLLGAIIRSGNRASAQKAWEALSPPMQDCMHRGLSLRRLSVEGLVNQGVGADDSRLARLIGQCKELTSKELRANIDCTIPVGGVPTQTQCNEVFAVETSSMTRIITRDQYILFGLRGESVSISQVETSEAMQARTDREAAQQAAAEEIQRQKQAAADVAAQRAAETQRQKQAAADGALRLSLTKRDQAIAANRKICVAKPKGDTGLSAASQNEHEVLSLLLNTNTPPLRVYRSTLAWLPNAKDRATILNALHDRIDYDANRWGETISRSGGGQYSWETLKVALDEFSSGCLWTHYDQLGIGAAKRISANSVAIALGQAQAVSAADRVSNVILSRIPSSQFVH